MYSSGICAIVRTVLLKDIIDNTTGDVSCISLPSAVPIDLADSNGVRECRSINYMGIVRPLFSSSLATLALISIVFTY